MAQLNPTLDDVEDVKTAVSEAVTNAIIHGYEMGDDNISSGPFKGMAGSHMPIAVSHGEGRVEFKTPENLTALQAQNLIVAQYIDSHLNVTETYPANPNGSALGITAISNVDGRIAAMMPHPERVFRAVSNSWYPEDWSEDGAWMRIFRNARVNFK